MLQSKIENKNFENLPNKLLLKNVHAIDQSEKLHKKMPYRNCGRKDFQITRKSTGKI